MEVDILDAPSTVDLPCGWEMRLVSSLGDTISGKALAANAPGRQRPYLRTKNVYDGRIDIDDVLTMPMIDSEFERFKVQNGDILLNEGQSIELVGRCSIYRGEYPGECAIQNQLLRFRAHAGTSADFAAHLFRYCQRTGIFSRIALQTTSVAHLGLTRFKNLVLRVPSKKHEQALIAEALSAADAQIECLETLIAKKRALMQGAMQELLTAKRRLPGFTNKWALSALGSIVWLYQPVTIPAKKMTESGYPVYGANGQVGFYSKFNHEQWQVTITCRGSTCGTVNRSVPRSWITGNAMVANCDGSDAVDKTFLYYLLRNTDLSKCITGTGQPQIVRGPLAAVEVRLPKTLCEQRAIADVLCNMDAEIEALDAQLLKARDIKQGMMQDLLSGRVRLL